MHLWMTWKSTKPKQNFHLLSDQPDMKTYPQFSNTSFTLLLITSYPIFLQLNGFGIFFCLAKLCYASVPMCSVNFSNQVIKSGSFRLCNHNHQVLTRKKKQTFKRARDGVLFSTKTVGIRRACGVHVSES